MPFELVCNVIVCHAVVPKVVVYNRVVFNVVCNELFFAMGLISMSFLRMK